MTLKQFSTGLMVAILGTLVTGLAFGGWHLREYLANNVAMKEEVLVASNKADYLLERREEAIVREMAELERVKQRTPTQNSHLENLRRQLEEARKVRRGK